MSYEAEARAYDQQTESLLTDRPQLSSTAAENFIYGVGQTVDYGLSISENIVRSTGGFDYEARDNILKNMRAEKTISDDEWTSFVRRQRRRVGARTDYDALAKYINSRDGTTIDTNEDIDSRMRATLKMRKEQAQDIFSRQTGLGAATELTGGFVGYGLEPLNALAMVAEPVLLAKNAYALSQATTRVGRALIAAKTGTKVGVATEAAIQPFLFNWHEEIGEDMTWTDAILNIASVGALSGVIGGAASGIRTKAKFENEQTAAKIYLSDNKITAGEFAGLIKSLRGEIKNTVDDVEADDLLAQAENALKGSDPDTPAEDVLRAIDDTEKQIEAQKTQADDYEDMDYEIDDNYIDRDFDALMALEDDAFKALSDEDLGADYFGFDELKLTPKEEGELAIKQITDMDKMANNLEACLLGQPK